MEMENGNYLAHPVSAALSYTKGGKERVSVVFEMEAGKTISWDGYFTEKTFERTIKALRLCGWTGDDLSDLSSIGASPVDVMLKVENESYEGKTYPRVQFINPPGGEGMSLQSQLSPDEAKAFAARMRGAILALGKPKAPAAKPANNTPAAGFLPVEAKADARVDDDLPF